jgi:folate-binding Fe-S cluster repair protein YgfZ
MDIISIIGFLLNQCNSLEYGEKKTITLKNAYIINQKVKNIIQKDGCYIDIKNENKVIISKTIKEYSIFDPNIEIENIISSKDIISVKLQKIEKIIKNYEINFKTAQKLKEFLKKIEKDANKKLKEKIEKIKQEIKVQSVGFA